MTIALSIIGYIVIWILMSMITWWIIIFTSPECRMGVFRTKTTNMGWSDFLFSQVWPLVLTGWFIIGVFVILRKILILENLNLFKIYDRIADNAIKFRICTQERINQ